MAKITKAQARRLLKAIDSKTIRLWKDGGWIPSIISTPDLIAIQKIVARSMKRLG